MDNATARTAQPLSAVTVRGPDTASKSHRTSAGLSVGLCAGVRFASRFEWSICQRSSFKAQQPEPPSLMMWQLRCVLNLPFLLATTAFVLPSGSNGPLQAALRVHPESPTPGSDREWNLPPNPNSTHHLIFNSVAGFLQRWPNTLRRNGAKLYCIYHRSHVNLLPRS